MAKISFTAGRISSFECPANKDQAFLWDSGSPGLGLRATPKSRAFVFQGSFQGQTVRLTIGSPADWSISQAQQRAREFQRQIDEGRDPRLVKAERIAKDVAARATEKREAITFKDVWDTYISKRAPYWSKLHYRDHLAMVAKGGEQRSRSKLSSVPGPLTFFTSMRLSEITPEVVQDWAIREAVNRPARVRLAIRLLKAFLRWSATEPAFAKSVIVDAANARKLREAAGKPTRKTDCLDRGQLKAWFEAICEIENPVISSYLQILLLTGARREELGTLTWAAIDWKWKKLELRDKMEGSREIPLTPYVEKILQNLARQNEWVFSSKISRTGRLVEPSIQHRKACVRAGLPHLTLHGLRRSFATLCEWIEIPGGISAQIQGHAPQGVREQNYVRRPVEMLRVHHQKIEAWILENAAVDHFIATS